MDENTRNSVKQKTKRRRTVKKKTVADSAVRNAAVLTDGCNPELVIGADFDGIFEIPIIKKPKKIIIPDGLVPFSKIDKADKKINAISICHPPFTEYFGGILTSMWI